jgi:hypothetical protein
MPFASPLALHDIVLAIMYGTWPRGNIHARDIEVRRFIAKFIKVTLSGYAASLQEILTIHNAMLEGSKSCETHFTDEYLELEKFDGFLQAERNPLFLDQHKVEPLFRALIVVVTPVLETPKDVVEQEVQLVHTGVTGICGTHQFRCSWRRRCGYGDHTDGRCHSLCAGS